MSEDNTQTFSKMEVVEKIRRPPYAYVLFHHLISNV